MTPFDRASLVLAARRHPLAHAAAADAAGSAALVAPALAFWILLTVLIGFTAISVWMWRGFDELWRQLTVEVSALTGNLLLVVLIVWGGAAATLCATFLPHNILRLHAAARC